MEIIKHIIKSDYEPGNKDVLWLYSIGEGLYSIRVCGPHGFRDVALKAPADLSFNKESIGPIANKVVTTEFEKVRAELSTYTPIENHNQVVTIASNAEKQANNAIVIAEESKNSCSVLKEEVRTVRDQVRANKQISDSQYGTLVRDLNGESQTRSSEDDKIYDVIELKEGEIYSKIEDVQTSLNNRVDNINSVKFLNESLTKTLSEISTMIGTEEVYLSFTSADIQLGDCIIQPVIISDLDNLPGLILGVISEITDENSTITWKYFTYQVPQTSISSIELTKDETGQITGGTAQLSDGSSVPITVTLVSAEG